MKIKQQTHTPEEREAIMKREEEQRRAWQEKVDHLTATRKTCDVCNLFAEYVEYNSDDYSIEPVLRPLHGHAPCGAIRELISETRELREAIGGLSNRVAMIELRTRRKMERARDFIEGVWIEVHVRTRNVFDAAFARRR